jgi:hypothetical protein
MIFMADTKTNTAQPRSCQNAFRDRQATAE